MSNEAQKPNKPEQNRRDGRMFQVNADRSSPSRKVRYVEGSMPDEQGCRLCPPK